ncbi:HD domain-containing phosphohydrolase [Caminicella sporogenes]|uniref:HD domain-containing phosphohydrolase n=1 Tax=Caminicella sporogenes TaxID=166485 RepID=UPI00254049ED|nr:HD domain-containing phosphohydrolase [Caminicella sporogenes]WIF95914.1 cache domain-containing protein [Caminicella sporogenes]
MFFKNSFRSRIFILLIIVMFIPIFFLGVNTYLNIYEYLIKQQNQTTLKNVINDTKLVDSWFEGKIKILKSMSLSLGLELKNNKNTKRINEYLKRQKENSGKNFLNIYITTKDGINYDSNSLDYNLKKVDFRKRKWYLEAKENDRLFISKPYEDIVTGYNVITVSIPIKDENGNFIGVLGMDFMFDKVIEQIKKINIGKNSFHVVIADDNSLLYKNDFVDGINYLPIIKKQGEFVKIDYNGKKLIGIYTRLNSINVGIITFEDVNRYYLQINKFIEQFIGIFIFTVIVAIFSVLYISKKISIPVVELKRGVRRLLEGNLDVQISTAADDDFNELMESFNLMAKALKKNYDDLKKQSKDLFMKNQLLKEMNLELEASFNQLRATTEQLNFSENKYRTLIENISDFIWLIDVDGTITYVNNSIQNILGYKPQDIIGKNISTIICSLDNNEDITDILNKFCKKDFKDYDLCFIKSDGKERVIIASNINRILDSSGKLIGIEGIGRDVTEKRKLEKRIVEQNEKLRTLNEISYYLVSQNKMDDLLNAIVNRICELFKIEICSIRLLKGEELKIMAFAGGLKELAYKKSINIHEDIIGKAVIEKKIIVLSNVIESNIYKEDKNSYKYIKALKCLIFIPLILESKVIGILTVGSIKKLNHEDIDMLKAFSNYATVVIEKTRLCEDLKESYFKTIKALATAVEAKDAYTEGHSVRVSRYSTLIAKFMGLDEKMIEEIKIAGILHDIGKIGINDAILTKPGKLTEEEFQEIIKHPSIGKKILQHIGLSQNILDGVLLHHKRYDLKGYPKDIQIDSLPLTACIIGVADAFDAMTTNRSYSNAKTMEEAMRELILFKGSQFCPKVVEVMEYIYNNHKEKLEEIINSI